ncbi:MAG: hypothetical protein LUG24_03415 [Clostridiales bacterium]|nr:hypothetical protein [Clostridiales bacterium]
MKTAVIYYSKHHGNTKKLLDEIKKVGDVTLIDASAEKAASLYGYDLIGFASGIYFGKYHKSVIDFAERCLPEKKNVFFIHTGGSPSEKNNAAVKKTAFLSFGKRAVFICFIFALFCKLLSYFYIFAAGSYVVAASRHSPSVYVLYFVKPV